MRPVIIYPPTIDWDQLHQRPQQLLKALSRLDAVAVFCNLNIHRQHASGLERLSDTLLLANDLPFSRTVAWARAAYPNSPIIIYFTYPPQIACIQSLQADCVIFDSVDEPAGEFAGWREGYAAAVRLAGATVASARSLADRACRYTHKPVCLIPNGCDFEHFAAASQRQTLRSPLFAGNMPVIGYIGAIAPWLDWSLLNTMARCLPEYQFVFIGSPLLQYGVTFANSNMHYLGHKKYEELPKYLSNFSFCLIPFKITEMTQGVNPVKFWEYLASGRPILSTALPEIPRRYATIIDETMFPGFIPTDDEAAGSARIEFACANSWHTRAMQLLSVIREQLEQG